MCTSLLTPASHEGMCSVTPVQVKNPSVDIPVGMIGATSIACVLYVMLALVLCAMVPAARMDPAAPFASAFAALASPGSGAWRAAFLHTSARFVSFGAFTGELAAQPRRPGSALSSTEPGCLVHSRSIPLNQSRSSESAEMVYLACMVVGVYS